MKKTKETIYRFPLNYKESPIIIKMPINAKILPYVVILWNQVNVYATVTVDEHPEGKEVIWKDREFKVFHTGQRGVNVEGFTSVGYFVTDIIRHVFVKDEK